MVDVPYAPARIRALPSWLLGRAAARGHRLVAEALAREGLRMMHHAVLASVAELGPVSQADLGRTLRVDPKDMVAIVNDLHREGLIARTPDPADRRKNAISISAAGSRRLRRTEKLGDEANDELTSALTPAERDQLVDLLARIVSPVGPSS
ncbi:MarR family winged helix-turn-helix transcriptional regulator [Amycolatopsis sp. EV170708-02-1]|uniref:MarR family winged helix-turn-helix transcriptional regulator n=1 Tax=Amycolatopsis sp. EV170708-02-1 TaxID=2919322 RepID=UPI001F0C330A|nr:MarR family winged helix-turn-helix transcriptional regulator [Amycolatopsis sp. EV170708-02-1]UMP00776.1 MarR family winged helix-turn-helix transcriptional regulator [Amycolatopsis sp. EV170708-02-1]